MRKSMIATQLDMFPGYEWSPCMQVPCLEASGSGGGGEDVFRVYRRGSKGPLLVLLHGGGYSALTWSLVVVSGTICYCSC